MRVWRSLGGAVFAFLAMNVGARAENFSCLWDSLSTSQQVRLELDARIGAAPLNTIYERWGDERFARYLAACEFAVEPQAVLRVGHYLSARAGAAVAEAELSVLGVETAALNAALDAEAPKKARRDFAVEIMTFDSSVSAGPAMQAVRAVSARLKGVSAEAQRLARLWAINRILASGLEQGAAPPKR